MSSVKCSNVRCGYRQRCVMISTDGVMVPSCVCPSYCCDGENDHVCDYNGMTYSSVCELLRTECMKGIYFGIKQCEKNSITVNQQLTTEPIGWNIKPVTITSKDNCSSNINIVNKVISVECSYNGNIYLPGDGVDHDDSCINAYVIIVINFADHHTIIPCLIDLVLQVVEYCLFLYLAVVV